jgi:hypothetical protein
MGYYVDVHGKITFKDLKGFKKHFPKKKEGHPWDYFFTKVWGDDLSEGGLKYAVEEVELDFDREGKYWYDDEAAIKYLAKYAEGTLYFRGEDEALWKWTFKYNEEPVRTERPIWK